MITGNEIADLKAKSTVESGTLVTDMDTPHEVMMFHKVIKEIGRQGFKRYLAGNLFVKMKKQRNIETKVYKEFTIYEAKKLLRLRSYHAGVGCCKAGFLGQSEECPKCGASETIKHLMIMCRKSEQERHEITKFFRQKKVHFFSTCHRTSTRLNSKRGVNFNCQQSIRFSQPVKSWKNILNETTVSTSSL